MCYAKQDIAAGIYSVIYAKNQFRYVCLPAAHIHLNCKTASQKTES